MCHNNVLTRGCGDQAARVMSGLVHDALHDPLYLRLRHRADCALHRQPSDSSYSEAPAAPTHHMIANGEVHLRPTLTAVFPVDDTNAENVKDDVETREKSSANQRPMDEADEDLISSELADELSEGDSVRDATARRQHEHNHDTDATALRDGEEDVSDAVDTDAGSLDGQISMLNGARRRSSSSALSVRQVSLLTVVLALLTTLLARWR